jgi:hypothetical protein
LQAIKPLEVTPSSPRPYRFNPFLNSSAGHPQSPPHPGLRRFFQAPRTSNPAVTATTSSASNVWMLSFIVSAAPYTQSAQ